MEYGFESFFYNVSGPVSRQVAGRLQWSVRWILLAAAPRGGVRDTCAGANVYIYMGQFPEDGGNGHFVSFFF